MHSSDGSVGSKKLLIATRVCLAAGVIWLIGLNVFATSRPFERHIPIVGIERINISNAASVTVNGSENDEVKLVATAKGGVHDKDIKVFSGNGMIELTCSTEKPISLTLHVPSREILNIKAFNGFIEIKNPVGIIFVDIRMLSSTSLSADKSTTTTYLDPVIRVETPPTSSVDLIDVQWASICDNPLPSSPCRPASRVKFGSGSPYVRFTGTRARVSVIGPPLDSMWLPARSLTSAARTLARHNNRMGHAIRRVEPRLSDSRNAGSPGRSTTEQNGDEINLQTQFVNLSISVTDRDGKAIPGLSKDNFRIYEDGVLQPISLFSSERTPFNLILLLDVSGSVEDKGQFLKEVAFHFLDVVNPDDNVGLISFAEDVTVISHLTNDRQKLRDAIENMRAPTGGTAFYDALGYVLTEEFSKANGQRNAVVVLTDGEDNALERSFNRDARRPPPAGSFLSFDDLLDGAQEAGLIVYPIHLEYTTPQNTIGIFVESPLKRQSTAQSSSGSQQNQSADNTPLTIAARKQMSALADVTGGRFYDANLIADLKQAYNQIASDLRTIYSVAYKPNNLNFDGKFRRIRVVIDKPDVVARTRRGYYAN